ncbi:MAG: flagellar filament capping protein FliD [Burkholderiales bacterium]|nr:flagellar filament capping protein FliD [Burkholderiales bacterium]
MALSAPGIGSNLDVNSMVSQLMAIERQPLTLSQTREATVQSQLSAYGILKSQIATFGDAAAALGKAEKLFAFKTTIADTEVATVTAGTSVAAGDYSLEVKQLAKVEKLATGNFATSTSTVGTGTLTISLGTYDSGGNTFTAGSTLPLNITIDSSNNTLAGVRDAINAANRSVSATIVTDNNGARLVISGKDTGSNNAIKIDAPGLAAFAFDPTAVGVQSVTRLQGAQDAKIMIDHLEIVSSTNQVKGAIDGITLNLTKAKPGTETTLSVARDNTSVATTLREFVTAFNSLNTMVRNYTKYDATTRTKGTLQGETTAVAVVNQMRTLVSSALPGGSGDLTRLADIGLSMQADGSLKLDELKLAKTTETGFDKLNHLFISSIGNTDTFPTRFKAFVDKTQGTNGLIDSKTVGLTARIKRFDQEQEKINDRLVTVQARLLKQFNALDSKLAAQTAVSTYLTNQTAIWTNSNSRN